MDDSSYKTTDVKPISPETAQYSATHDYNGQPYASEGLIRNSSVPCESGDDLNLFTWYYFSAPSQVLPKARNQLLQILSSFDPGPQFGSDWVPLMQTCSNMKGQNPQLLFLTTMRNIQTNQQMMRQSMGTAIHMGEQKRPKLEAWPRIFSGTEIAVDPTTGKRYEVPVGGQCIYGDDVSSKVIRSSQRLTLNEIPPGIKQLESVGLN
jgi:hypothetical protein